MQLMCCCELRLMDGRDASRHMQGGRNMYRELCFMTLVQGLPLISFNGRTVREVLGFDVSVATTVGSARSTGQVGPPNGGGHNQSHSSTQIHSQSGYDSGTGHAQKAQNAQDNKPQVQPSQPDIALPTCAVPAVAKSVAYDCDQLCQRRVTHTV